MLYVRTYVVEAVLNAESKYICTLYTVSYWARFNMNTHTHILHNRCIIKCTSYAQAA